MQRFAFLIAVFFFQLTLIAQAADLPTNPKHYYGRKLQKTSSKTLKAALHKTLNSIHLSSYKNFDKIVEDCPSDSEEDCYTHRSMGYKNARKHMFGRLYLLGSSPSNYHIMSVYCEDDLLNKDFPNSKNLGPMKIPSSSIINAEHSWPQSKFNSAFSKGLQKSDLHALYPVRMRVNSTRSNHPFGEVHFVKSSPCDDAQLGLNHRGDTVFEPTDSIKGDIARSLFYFSVRYDLPIDAEQEKVLRRWHKQDPINYDELEKHEEVYYLQQVRNPFIDYPEWVDRIPNF